jgi:hypothetical protein
MDIPIHVLAINADIRNSECGQIVQLFRQNGVNADTVSKKLHLPKDVVQAAWDVFQATGKCQ